MAPQVFSRNGRRMQIFRNFFKSKLGIPITLAFVVLIGFAFATSDVAMNSTFGGVAGGERVAVVGDEKINSSDLVDAANNAIRNIREQNPTISMPAFVEQGGLDDVIEQLIARTSLAEFAREYGLRAGDNLVNSEILQIPGIRGADGNFNQDAYLESLSRMGMTDAKLRDELGALLLARQLLVPAQFGAKAPESVSSQYAALLKETRRGTVGLLPSAAFAPKTDPKGSVLTAYYNENKGDYVRPERRTIRYATFGVDALGERGEPTAEEIKAFYDENRQQFEATERRTITQFIVPTQQAAASFRERIAGGATIGQVASEAGLTTATVEGVTKEEFAGQTAAAVANAVFAAERGSVAAPARSGLGYHVARIDSVDRQAGRTLDQAREEIREVLRFTKLREAVTDLASELEGQIVDGASISEIAKEVGAELKVTQPLTGAGIVYGNAQQRAPEVLAPAIQTAFDMDEGEPELVEIEAGETFLVFEVAEITPSASAPLKEIRERVVADWKNAQGAKLAKAASDRILARLKDGQTLAAAMQAENTALPPADPVNLSRQQLAQLGRRVPPPLALMFSMAEGTFKKLEAPQNAGWFIVDLDDIEAGEIAQDDPLLTQTRQELARAMGAEYNQQLRNAISKEMGVEKNDDGIEAVRKQLVGEQ